jgi:hypothetical protein
MPVTVLYEDDWGPGEEFKLHHFVSQCVIDCLGWTLPLHQVRTSRLQGIPVGGNADLRKKCQRDLKKLSDRNVRVFALYDNDKAARLVNLVGNACRPMICQRLKEGCDPVNKLEIVLLQKNLETVIEVIRDSGLTSIQPQMFQDALCKRCAMRDRVFSHCAYLLTPDARTRLLERLPDLGRLVSKIAECLKQEPSGE